MRVSMIGSKPTSYCAACGRVAYTEDLAKRGGRCEECSPMSEKELELRMRE